MDMHETAQPEAVMTANQPDNEGAPQEHFLTVRYNKQDKPLSREEAAEYAQKGLNYDKVSERLAQANEKLGAYENVTALASELAARNGITEAAALDLIWQKLSDERDRQAGVNSQLEAFMKEHPNVDPLTLPRAVLDAWKDGTPLTTAYAQMLQNQELLRETNARNAEASMGGATGMGAATPRPISHDAIKTMSSAELERNHSRIWAFLTGQKET